MAGEGGRKFRLHVATVVVVAVGVAATLAGFAAASNSVRQNDDALLKQTSAQGAIVLGSLMSATQVPVGQLASVVTAGMSGALFDRDAKSVTSAVDGPIALLHESHGHIDVVGSVGTLHRSFGDASDATLAAMWNSPTPSWTQVEPAGGTNWLGQLFGPKSVALPAGYAIYVELGVPPVIPLSALKGIPFSGIQAAIYLSHERPSDLVFATTRALPLKGERAVADIDPSQEFGASNGVLSSHAGSLSAPGELIVVMNATRHLSGATTARLPWLLLGVGGGATMLVALALGLALRRRDLALGLVTDLEIKNAELDRAVKREAEAQEGLRRAQRMEAMGRLAGGIAHDFNNLLHVILCNAGFLTEAMDADDPLKEEVDEVQKAARRAAELTKQLLVFSRRDVVRTEVVELNDVIVDAERLLNHTMGEDVVLVLERCPEPCPVVADKGELSQVLMNLGINARDAMSSQGRLTISLHRVEITPKTVRNGLPPGPYARIDFTDTGVGMTPEVAARAFEPFFTTKDTGRGTGLGLAMVYGIVDRWGGFVWFDTAPKVGTTVRILLPITSDRPAPQEEIETPPKHGGGETVLFVEDELGVRKVGVRVLQEAGYRVLEAADAAEAEQVFAKKQIDILVTDVIMPGGRSGKQLADDLLARRPDLPVVFVSAYGAQTILERGGLGCATNLLEKPFTSTELLETVRTTLVQADVAAGR